MPDYLCGHLCPICGAYWDCGCGVDYTGSGPIYDSSAVNVTKWPDYAPGDYVAVMQGDRTRVLRFDGEAADAWLRKIASVF